VNTLITVLERITKFKAFPYYGAERRIDIILSVFLPAIIKNALYPNEQCNIDFIMPELPLKQENNQADCVDYLLSKTLNGEIEKLLLVELKTDVGMISKDQFIKYKNMKWHDVVNGIKEKSLETEYKNRIKYFNLLEHLVAKNLLTKKDSHIVIRNDLLALFKLSTKVHKEKMKIYYKMAEYCESIFPNERIDNIEVIYLGPKNDVTDKISGLQNIYFQNLDEKMENEYPEDWVYIVNTLRDMK